MQSFPKASDGDGAWRPEDDQADIPSVYMGNVQTSTASGSMEVSGTGSLLNASPAGEWSVVLGKDAGGHQCRVDPKDEIEILAYCVGIPASRYLKFTTL